MNLENKGNSVPIQQKAEAKSRRMLNIAAVFLLLSFLLFLCQLIHFGVFNVGASGADSLPVSIRANSQADYSSDEEVPLIPPIDGDIFRQIIMDTTATGSTEDRFATLEAMLSSPVPTMTSKFPTPAFTQTFAPTPTRTSIPTVSITQTPTPFFTPTKFVTPTKTPIPTQTFIPTYTAVRTSTPIEENPIIVPDTEEVLPTETYTLTPTLTPTPTPTDTLTPTSTNTPVCMLTSSGILLSGKNLETNITNNGDTLATITGITVNWPDEPTSQNLIEVNFKGMTLIENTNDPSSPSDYPYEKSWTGTQSDRELSADDSGLLIVLFKDDLQSTNFSITVTFDDGCALNEGY